MFQPCNGILTPARPPYSAIGRIQDAYAATAKAMATRGKSSATACDEA